MPIPQVQVTPVAGERDLHRFVLFPWKIYTGDPNWVPPLIGDTKNMLRPAKHPFHRHAEVQLFLARAQGEVAGRIAAIVNHRHNEFHGEKTAFFGFFESVNDPAVAGALLEVAAAWASERGMERLRGPASFSTNEECALLVEGFDSPPRVMMPYNPRYYAGLLEGAGFVKAKDLIAYNWPNPQIPEAFLRLCDRVMEREKVTIRPLNMKDFPGEIERFAKVYNQAWERNWGFVPMTREEIDHMARALKPAVDPNLILFLERGGEPIGFAMALPDVNTAIRHANGRLFPFGLLKILYHARRIDRARVLVLGVLKEDRGKALDLPLYVRLTQNGLRRGMRESEFSWILEDNVAIRSPIEKLGAQVYKTYRFYERPIG